MKRISFFVLLASAAIAFSISSCDKDDQAPSVSIRSINAAPAPASAPYIINLIADRWTKITTAGVYTCSFKNIVPADYRNNRGMKVYLLTTEPKIQIDSPINFMGGELSAITNPSDVTLNYRYYNALPFVSLNIIVEVY